MTTERDADALTVDQIGPFLRAVIKSGETLNFGDVRDIEDAIEAALRAQGDSASTLHDHDQLAVPNDAFPYIAGVCPNCGTKFLTAEPRRDSATTEGAVREAAAAYMAHVQALACDHGTNAGTHTSCPEALALRRALLADVPDEREGAGS